MHPARDEAIRLPADLAATNPIAPASLDQGETKPAPCRPEQAIMRKQTHCHSDHIWKEGKPLPLPSGAAWHTPVRHGAGGATPTYENAAPRDLQPDLSGVVPAIRKHSEAVFSPLARPHLLGVAPFTTPRPFRMAAGAGAYQARCRHSISHMWNQEHRNEPSTPFLNCAQPVLRERSHCQARRSA
jgi:hypothetical protein